MTKHEKQILLDHLAEASQTYGYYYMQSQRDKTSDNSIRSARDEMMHRMIALTEVLKALNIREYSQTKLQAIQKGWDIAEQHSLARQGGNV